MIISEQFSGSYFKAADVSVPKVVTIQAVTHVELEGEKKVAIQFADEQQRLIANKTNAYCIAEMHGDDTASWPGKQVELYSTQTSFSGRMVPCIRVRAPQQAAPLQPAPQPAFVQSQQPEAAQPQVQQVAPQPEPGQPPAAPPTDYAPVDA